MEAMSEEFPSGSPGGDSILQLNIYRQHLVELADLSVTDETKLLAAQKLNEQYEVRNFRTRLKVIHVEP